MLFQRLRSEKVTPARQSPLKATRRGLETCLPAVLSRRPVEAKLQRSLKLFANSEARRA